MTRFTKTGDYNFLDGTGMIADHETFNTKYFWRDQDGRVYKEDKQVIRVEPDMNIRGYRVVYADGTTNIKTPVDALNEGQDMGITKPMCTICGEDTKPCMSKGNTCEGKEAKFKDKVHTLFWERYIQTGKLAFKKN